MRRTDRLHALTAVVGLEGTRRHPLSALRRRTTTALLLASCIGLAAAVASCSDAGSSSKPTASSRQPSRPPASGTGSAITPGVAADGNEGDWIRPARDLASTRFSPLGDVRADNVSTLHLAWTFGLGATNGEEAAPIVVGDTMFVVTAWPNYVYALDLSQHGAMKWKYEPKPAGAAKGVACCDVVTRGLVWDNGRLFFNTLDDYTIALDAATGREVWKTKLGDINRGETITMAPLVAKGKVLVGNSGGEFGVRGWLAGLDAATGKIVWRAYGTGPDRDVLIGPGFKPFYAFDRGKDLGVSTWPADQWKIGGATSWGWISYDPALDLIYYGTGNPGPWNPAQRPGDNKWSSGIFARRPDTGEAVWYYQFSPADQFDYDAINEQILLDMPVDRQTRKVLVRPERNGYMYVMDRATGQVYSATPYGHITTTSGVDLKTGRLRYVEEKKPQVGIVVRDICPASPGAKDWNPSAFSPRTGLVYVPHNNLCQDSEGVEANYIEGTPYVGMNVHMYGGPGGHRGIFTAWDPVAARATWEIKERFPVWSGALATAGDVVFYGTMEGWFKGVDARTGEVKWTFKTASGIVSQPVSFRGPDGKQYIAVLDGVGGWAGAIVSNGLDARDTSAAAGFVGAMGDLPNYTQKGGTLYVFALSQ